MIMYVTGKLVKTVKEFWQITFVPCMHKFEGMQAIYVSNVNALWVFLPERVAKNINLITRFCLVCILCKFVLLVLPQATITYEM